MVFGSIFEDVEAFIERGGPMMAIIFVIILLIWALAFERMVYLRVVFPERAKAALEDWNSRSDKTSWYAYSIRRAMLSRIRLEAETNLGLINTLVAISPMCGLLGTVVGMISVFHVMMVLGNSDVRALAAGVSEATLTTMAGMVGALSGLFLSRLVQRRTRAANAELERALHAGEEDYSPASARA
ncbi:MAG: MotA/TolQ/ExbB proton channel family protein [Sphingomonadales bacterium]|nr:MotA/TolQ/ExbB proton channel family protein [Sphingomonadales bacterium]